VSQKAFVLAFVINSTSGGKKMGKIWTPSQKLAETGYRLKNYAALLRAAKVDVGVALGNALGVLTIHGELRAKLIRADGTVIDLGLLGKRLVTDEGVAHMVDDWHDGSGDIANFNFHDSGTGVAAENVADGDLGTPAGPTTRATGAKSQPTANQIRSIGTIAYTATLAITEHGLFTTAARATHILWDRTVFGAINVDSGDSIQFTYTCTINAGG